MDALPIKAVALRAACSNCNLRELCLPVALSADELQEIDTLVAARRPVPRGATLFHAGDRFDAVYAVRLGFFKSCVASDDGREQVTGFHMAGDLLGFDGISSMAHACDAVALEDSQVCVIPFEQLEAMSRMFSGLQRQFNRIMSRELVRDQGVMLLLGSMRAEERVAAFLLDLIERLRSRGFSATSLVLRMSREEIGSYLGLTLETVSRVFSMLRDSGVLEVRRRHVEVLDEAALRQLTKATLC